MQQHPGLKDVSDNDLTGVQEAIVSLKPNAELLGLNLARVMAQVRAAFFGVEAQQLQRGDDEVEIWVRYPRDERQNERSLRDMRITGPGGRSYPLTEVARIDYGTGSLTINHLEGQREIRVEANVASMDVSAPTVIGELEEEVLSRLVADYPGVDYSIEGQNRQSFKMAAAIRVVGPIVLALIFGLIVLNFNSFSQALMVFSLFPFAIIGVVLGHWIHATTLNLFSMIGTIALIGVFTNNSLVFISTFNQLLQEGWTFAKALRETARSRFRPILLTTVTTVAGLGPLILSSSLGAQFLKGPAIAIAYGLSFGLLNVLILLPVFLVILNGLRRLLYKAGKGGPSPTKEEVEPAVRAQGNRLNEDYV
jgi:multidrug efflux pump subunit AcrB